MRSFEGHFEVMWARFSLFQNETEQNKSARYTFHHHKDLDNLCFGNLDLRFKVHQEDTHPLSNLKMGQIILYRVLRTFFCPSTISVYKNCLRPCTIHGRPLRNNDRGCTILSKMCQCQLSIFCRRRPKPPVVQIFD